MNKDIFIEHPLLHKKECKKNTNVLVKKSTEKIIEEKQEDKKSTENVIKQEDKESTENVIKQEDKESTENVIKQEDKESTENVIKQEDDDKLIRRKSTKLKKCRRLNTKNPLLKVDSPKVDSPEVDKVFSKFKLNNIIYFYDDKDQKCVLKNNSDNLFSIEKPKDSEDSNYKLMEDTHFQMDNIEKNSFLMTEIGKKQVDIVEEDNNTTCIII
jgi:hypothetical protein